MTFDKRAYNQYRNFYTRTGKRHEMDGEGPFSFEQWHYQARMREKLLEEMKDPKITVDMEYINKQLVVEQRGVGSDNAENAQWNAVKDLVKELKSRNPEDLSADELSLIRMREGRDKHYYKEHSGIFLKTMRRIFANDEAYDNYIFDHSPKNN